MVSLKASEHFIWISLLSETVKPVSSLLVGVEYHNKLLVRIVFCLQLLQPIRKCHTVVRISAPESGAQTNVSSLSKQASLPASAAARTQTNKTLIIDQNQWEADRKSICWRLQRSGTTQRHKGSTFREEEELNCEVDLRLRFSDCCRLFSLEVFTL